MGASARACRKIQGPIELWSPRVSAPRHPWVDERSSFKALIVGVGLIGGSLALALRRRFANVCLLGIDHPPTLATARERGIIDEGYTPDELDVALARGPDVLILATGVGTILSLLPRIDAHQRSAAVPARLVLDVGSVKRTIVERARVLGLPHFVGGHPMAGRERGGIDSADITILEGCRFVLCPTSESSPEDIHAAELLVRRCGCDPLVMQAEVHDRCAAMVSHLPHLAAWSLMAVAHRLSQVEDNPDLPWGLAAGSWRDATRVAAASPELWEGIFQANRDEVRAALDRWLEVLGELRHALAEEDRPILDVLDATTLTTIRQRLDPWLRRERQS